MIHDLSPPSPSSPSPRWLEVGVHNVNKNRATAKKAALQDFSVRHGTFLVDSKKRSEIRNKHPTLSAPKLVTEWVLACCFPAPVLFYASSFRLDREGKKAESLNPSGCSSGERANHSTPFFSISISISISIPIVSLGLLTARAVTPSSRYYIIS